MNSPPPITVLNLPSMTSMKSLIRENPPSIPSTTSNSSPPSTDHLSDIGVRQSTPELVAAFRAVRFGIYDALYGYLEFIGYQLLAVGSLVTPVNMEVTAALLGVGNEVLGFGYLAQG